MPVVTCPKCETQYDPGVDAELEAFGDAASVKVVCPVCAQWLRLPENKAIEGPRVPKKVLKELMGQSKIIKRASKDAPPSKPKPKPKSKAGPTTEPVTEDMYGFTPEADLAEIRRKREAAEKKREEEEKKKEKPIIEIKRKNIGDHSVWEQIDRSLIWFTIGIWIWGAAHLVYGLVLFLGMVQGPEYAGPVAAKLIRQDPPPLQVGVGDALDRPSFVVAMLGGMDTYYFTLVLLILMHLISWGRIGTWVTGSTIAWKSADAVPGGKGQIIAIYSLIGANWFFAFFLVFLPLTGLYRYWMMPWQGAELAMATDNMERMTSIHVFWAYAPFWESLFSFVLTVAVYAEPFMIAYFLWSCAARIKHEEAEKATYGAVKMGLAVLFILIVYRLVALAGTSPVLVKLLRAVYLFWYVMSIVWMLRLAGAISKCRDMFRFYFHPDED